MIGTNQWVSILRNVEKAKANLVVVGDDHQFKAIEAGDFFRKLKDKAENSDRLSSLETIIRQKENWMRNASQDLAELKTYQALANYEQNGHIQKLDKDDLKTIAELYVEKRNIKPEEIGLLLASTRVQCQILNDETRRILKNHKLVSELDIQINDRTFSVGDEIIFLKNDRNKVISCFDDKMNHPLKDFLVKNGTRGKIISLNADNTASAFNASNKITHPAYQLTVEINKNTLAKFSTADYHHFDHGYAITLHKAQGQTVDWSMVIASKNMNAHATYVALTRHRKDITLFYDSKTFNGFKDLQKSLSRISNKDLAIDYTIRPEHQGAWENVQKYLLLGQDLASASKEKDCVVFQNLKKERKILGQTILSEWKDHLPYVHQAGLSKEFVEIACGLKTRPLSSIEQQAQLTVREYARKTMETRLLWREIRKTHPGDHCYEHSKYSKFTKIRQERNQIANEIINNKLLYKEFISELNHNVGIGWKTLNSQSRQWHDNLSHEYFIKNYTSKYGIVKNDAIHSLDISYVNKILDQYNLFKPSRTTDEVFVNNIKALFERMTGWHKFLGTSTANENQKLMDKAIITEAIKPKAKSEYCFLSRDCKIFCVN